MICRFMNFQTVIPDLLRSKFTNRLSSVANQHFYELKQCQKNNWLQKSMDRVDRPQQITLLLLLFAALHSSKWRYK